MRNRYSLLLGLALIVLGGWFLAVQLVPGLRDWWQVWFAWPLYVIGSGVALFLIALLSRTPGLAVPASIVTGVGSLLYWQNATGNWDSWSYAWSLIPGFVGIGVILTGLLEGGNFREALRGGGTLLVISVTLFTIFGSFLGGPVSFGVYWPVVLIVLGVWFLIGPLLRPRNEHQ